MTDPFLPKEYVALALIEAKFRFFNENFATTIELNQFTEFMQRKFNERKLGIVIKHDLRLEDFNIKNGIVTITDRCCFNLKRLSNEILNILTDETLILEFFVNIETKKLEILKSFPEYPVAVQSNTAKLLSLIPKK